MKQEYPNGIKYYKYKCNICGWDNGHIQEYSLYYGTGCSCCAGRTVVEGINDIPTTAPWMVPYFQGGYDEAKLYMEQSKKRVCFKCPDCGKIKTKTNYISSLYNNHSIGCSCGDGKSYPHKFMCSILDQLSIVYEEEYSPEWLGRKSFDFYIASNNLIIEIDGDIGHGRPYRYKGAITPEKSRNNDNYKDCLANEHEIKVIRIEAVWSKNEYLKNNITQALNNIFDLSNIDWMLCEQYANSNIMKMVCEYYENTKPTNAKIISEQLNLNDTTVWRYLKRGYRLGWCTYDVYDIFSNKHREVSIYKNSECLGTYKSCFSLARKSMENFGVFLNPHNISAVALGKVKTHKGYNFKYTN